jgi:hypothetical protein
VLSMTRRLLYPGKSTPCLLLRGVRGTQELSGEFGRGKSFYLRPGFIARLFGCPANTLVTVHTEFRLFTFDSVRVLTCLVKSVFVSWNKEMNSELTKLLFQSRSICDRNTRIGSKGLLE